MRGGRANHLLKKCKYIGRAQTCQNYKLYTKISYPCMVIDQQNPQKVPGEIYLVDLYTLKFLNEYEGVDVGLYSLSVIEIENIYSDEKIDVAFQYCMSYLYLGDVSHLQVIEKWQENAKHEY